MKHVIQPRTLIYHSMIGKFDLIEKCDVSSWNLIQNTSAINSWEGYTNSKDGLKTLLFNNCFNQSRFSFQKSFTSFIFKATLRKKRFFMYLEALINFYLVKQKLKPKTQKNNIPQIISLLKFSNCLILPFYLISQLPLVLVESTIECNVYFSSNQQVEVWLSYYFYS